MSGFLGEYLGRRLTAEGCRAMGTCHTRPVTIPGLEVEAIDLSNAGSVHSLIERWRPEVVFHCAATTDVAFCEQNPGVARQAITVATSHLVETMRKQLPAAHLVALSTDLVFDGEHAPYREGDPPGPLSVYGRLKAEAEQVVLDSGVGIVIRSALLYGPPTTCKGSFLAWMKTTLEAGKPLPLFTDEVRTPVFVGDLCSALVRLGEAMLAEQPLDDVRRLWHAGGPERLSRFEMGQALCQRLGVAESLLQPTRLVDSTYAAPRPRDVSLQSDRLWAAVGLIPTSFRAALQQC